MRFCASMLAALLATASATACSSTNQSTASRGGSTAPPLTILPGPKVLDTVHVTKCGKNAHNKVVVTGTVRNTETKTASFVVRISIRDRKNKPRYAAAARVRSLKPGKTKHWKAVTTARYQKGTRCEVTGLKRT